MKTKNIQEVVEEYYSNIALKNYEATMLLFADQVDWRIPGNEKVAPWVKYRKNREEVREFFKDLVEYVEGVSFEVTGKFYDGNQAVVTGHLVTRIRATDKLFESDFTVQFTVENGLITRYLMLEDSFGLVESLKP